MKKMVFFISVFSLVASTSWSATENTKSYSLASPQGDAIHHMIIQMQQMQSHQMRRPGSAVVDKAAQKEKSIKK